MFDPNKDTSQDFLRGLFDADYWRSLAPNLSITDRIEGTAIDFGQDDLDTYNNRLIKEGYTQITDRSVDLPLVELTSLFTQLDGMGLPPVFSFVFDELWTLNRQLGHIMTKVVGDNFLVLPDFWGWYVPAGQAGWAPHRDKEADCLLADGKPKWVTVWIPLTEATPTNSCMYVLPADRDPFYGIMGADGFRGELSDVRALPGNPGDIYMWTQHLLHWGSSSVKGHTQPPRMSIAIEFQRCDVAARDKPLINPAITPSFEQRLALIAKQIWYYRDMLGEDMALFQVAKEIHTRLSKTLKPLHTAPNVKRGLLGRLPRRRTKANR